MDAKRARGMAVAFVAAVGILVWQVVEPVLLTLIPVPVYVGSHPVDQVFLIAGAASNALSYALPYAIGVFLSLALVAPVGGTLRVGHVVTRSLLALAIGAAATAIGLLLGSFVFYLTADVSGVTDIGSLGERIGLAFLSALRGGIETAIGAAPITVLAGVLSWVWLRKRPTRQVASGKLDEV